ncbi:hypothetical protein CJ739_3716 [Mariniflexile rhizosphaerae]|uniref:hypothetical protein n=1 Tax=unclassified Mariniflexile TaxID=2643887 RepID=UPI000CB661A9|nr:hypothetical protein [Mariniflexile sp. TRM1-10]AXP82776.1 hypothetical protein CJ739_3716 [Mariniflexile sp. TRM1-10]PLB19031.1 MAG: hypothetical protein TRG1_2058 [Flavobacteriaceae bacterium FS1-H7996/R]
MRFENSNYYNITDSKMVTLSIGDFYFLDSFCIAEIKEGVHIGTEECQEIIIALVDYYGEDLKIGFISNRINSFSIDLSQWVKFNIDYDFIIAIAIVCYNDLNFNIATIEKEQSTCSTKRCYTLNQAIEWITNLKEFKNMSPEC